MKIYSCRDCGDQGFGPCCLIVEDEERAPEWCPYDRESVAIWALRVYE